MRVGFKPAAAGRAALLAEGPPYRRWRMMTPPAGGWLSVTPSRALPSAVRQTLLGNRGLAVGVGAPDLARAVAVGPVVVQEAADGGRGRAVDGRDHVARQGRGRAQRVLRDRLHVRALIVIRVLGRLRLAGDVGEERHLVPEDGLVEGASRADRRDARQVVV